MYLRLTRGQVDPSKADAAQQAAAAVIAAVKALPGCQGVQSGADPETGRTIAVSTFDTREHASFSRERIAEPFQALLALGYIPQDPEIYEIQ
jgi:quinol monooxygenase YgiN